MVVVPANQHDWPNRQLDAPDQLGNLFGHLVLEPTVAIGQSVVPRVHHLARIRLARTVWPKRRTDSNGALV
jgi:hypothetical protein